MLAAALMAAHCSMGAAREQEYVEGAELAREVLEVLEVLPPKGRHARDSVSPLEKAGSGSASGSGSGSGPGIIVIASTTEAATTDAPAVTDAPATAAPATDAPVVTVTTDAPATDAPVVTDAPATDAPATDEPTTKNANRAGNIDVVDGQVKIGQVKAGAVTNALVLAWVVENCETMLPAEVVKNVQQLAASTPAALFIDVARSQAECTETATRHRRAAKDNFQATLVFHANVSKADVDTAVQATNAAIAIGQLSVTFTVGGKTADITLPKDATAKVAAVSASGAVTVPDPALATTAKPLEPAVDATTAKPLEPAVVVPTGGAFLARGSAALLAAAAAACALLL